MKRYRKLTIFPLLLLVLLGVVLTFDQRLVSIKNEPAMAVYLYAPTALFVVIGIIQCFRRRYWPAVAFTLGLIGTGLFHQYVIGMYHGNPGYMFPGGHLVAPIVSVAAYSLSFLGAWVTVKMCRRMQGTNSQSDE